MIEKQKLRSHTEFEQWDQIFWAQTPRVTASSWASALDEVDSRRTKWKKIGIYLWGDVIELLDA